MERQHASPRWSPMHEHWLAQAHNAEASELALAAQRNGVGDTDAWAATVLAAAQAQGFDSPSGVLLAAKLLAAPRLDRRDSTACG
jgi:hypothetical protein